MLLNKQGKLSVIDIDDVEIAEFPKEIEKYARGLINLYSNFGMDVGAAFRYGVLTATGKVGYVLYDIMYNNHQLSCLGNIHDVRDVNIEYSDLNKIFIEWNDLVKNSFVKKVTHGTYKYREFSYAELMERNLHMYVDFKEKYKDDIDILKHEYQVYFANAVCSENKVDTLRAALMLCQLEFLKQRYFLAAYYYFVARKISLENEEYMKAFEKEIMYAGGFFVSKFGKEEGERILNYVSYESLRLRIDRILVNYFYEIWYWEDFSRLNEIEKYTKERKYGTYVCLNCGYINSYEDKLNICEMCGSQKLKEISLEEYIELKKDMLDFDKKGTIEEVDYFKEEIPILDNIELLPLYIQIVNFHEKKKEYEVAIKKAKCIESFLKDNVDIFDEEGYVIEKAKVGGQLFYSSIEPNEMAKFFLNGNDRVRNDYESYICHKLCVLYEKINDKMLAVKYAEKVINLANNSPRWLHQSYVKHAYLIMKKYFDEIGEKKDYLMYSNILFMYNMLDKIDKTLIENIESNVVENIIEDIMDIGSCNEHLDNIFIAYSCYILALKLHIHNYGIRHPEGARIYSNIAHLSAKKKRYEDAFLFWSVALLLLEKSGIERYMNQIGEIEKNIEKYLIESGYQKDIDIWKKEQLTDEVFETYVQRTLENAYKKGKELKKIEITEKERYREYTVYNA